MIWAGSSVAALQHVLNALLAARQSYNASAMYKMLLSYEYYRSLHMWSVKKRMEIVTKYFASLFGAVSFQEKGEDADNNFSKGSSSIKVDIFKKDEG